MMVQLSNGKVVTTSAKTFQGSEDESFSRKIPGPETQN